MIKVTRDIKINFKLEHKIREKLNSFLNHMIRLFVDSVRFAEPSIRITLTECPR